MGFRNPITSATNVDTGRGLSNAGVRMYQDETAPGVPVGVVEWRTGQMQRNATAKLAGGGSGGSSFTINGGSSQLVDAPEIAFNVEQLAPGGYASVARLRDVDFTFLQGTVLSSDAAESAKAGLPAGMAEWTDNSYYHLRFIATPEGLVFVNGLILAAAGATTQITAALGGPYAPRSRASENQGVWPILNGSVADTPRLFEVRPTGIFLRGAAPAAGQFLTLNGFYESATRNT